MQPGVTAIVDLLLSQTHFCKAWDTEQQVELPKAPRLKNTWSWAVAMAGGGSVCPTGHRSFAEQLTSHIRVPALSSLLIKILSLQKGFLQ